MRKDYLAFAITFFKQEQVSRNEAVKNECNFVHRIGITNLSFWDDSPCTSGQIHANLPFSRFVLFGHFVPSQSVNTYINFQINPFFILIIAPWLLCFPYRRHYCRYVRMLISLAQVTNLEWLKITFLIIDSLDLDLF